VLEDRQIRASKINSSAFNAFSTLPKEQPACHTLL